MSWSIHFIGKRQNIIEAIKAHSEKLTGDSKKEYDSYQNDLVNLVEANYNENEQPVLEISAYGHRSAGYSSLTLSLGYAPGTFV
jgi:hypothetical protein